MSVKFIPQIRLQSIAETLVKHTNINTSGYKKWPKGHVEEKSLFICTSCGFILIHLKIYTRIFEEDF